MAISDQRRRSGCPKPAPVERREEQPHDHPRAGNRRAVGARVHDENEPVVAEGTADARERANRQAFDQPATRCTEHGAQYREEQRTVQDPRRHGVTDADRVPDQIAKSGGCGNHRNSRDRVYAHVALPVGILSKDDGRRGSSWLMAFRRSA